MNIGQVYSTNNYGKLVVTEYFNAYKVSIKFLDTGYETTAQASQIRQGTVKDYKAPSVRGVGYLGQKGNIDLRAYKSWNRILKRCYENTETGYIVCKEWLDFSKFQVWYLDNYKDNQVLHLVGNTYSPETCTFVSKEETARAWQGTLSMEYCMKNKTTGEVVVFTNQAKFSKERQLNASNVCQVLKGNRKSHKGWVKVYAKEAE